MIISKDTLTKLGNNILPDYDNNGTNKLKSINYLNEEPQKYLDLLFNLNQVLKDKFGKYIFGNKKFALLRLLLDRWDSSLSDSLKLKENPYEVNCLTTKLFDNDDFFVGREYMFKRLIKLIIQSKTENRKKIMALMDTPGMGQWKVFRKIFSK
eukprot:TRINITY_DN4745_c0_g1_i1.p1 TRINITY_DN4745_c0_g1~~TRINITY_DN4745_c0_g1_i1.p1  ORF type:complete len:153 (+),score=23.66 TRINITY_DN4745_c0_g1_i1:85-543(+)